MSVKFTRLLFTFHESNSMFSQLLTEFIISTNEVIFSYLVCLFVWKITQKRQFNRFSQNSVIRWHVSHGGNGNQRWK